MHKTFTIVIILVVVIILGIVALQFISPKSVDTPAVTNNQTPSMSSEKTIQFSGSTYQEAFTLPGGGSDFSSESYEWTASPETVDNWTTLITTHKLTPQNDALPLDAAAYAQNVAAMLESQGALMLETSLINQDMEAFGIDPEHPPYLLAYLFAGEGTTEFNMQKIVQLENGQVGSLIYAERFPTKTEPEMKAYYDSKERTDKRIELIKLQLPY